MCLYTRAVVYLLFVKKEKSKYETMRLPISDLKESNKEAFPKRFKRTGQLKIQRSVLDTAAFFAPSAAFSMFRRGTIIATLCIGFSNLRTRQKG